MTIRVIVADDHPAMRAGVAALLASAADIAVVGEAADGAEALDLIARERPDVAVLDLRMPVLDGSAAAARIAAEHPATAVLILTTYDTDGDIERALDAGALGYLLKDAGADHLTGAVRAAARGEAMLAPSVAARLVARLRRPAPVALTPRETQVLQAVADGLSNPAIGARLYITEATVKTHLLRAFTKLEVGDRTAAVVEAMRRGLLPGPDDPSL